MLDLRAERAERSTSHEPRLRDPPSAMSESMSEISSGEQRRDDRVNYDLPVFFYFPMGRRKPRDAVYHKGYTQDVSRTGIRVFIEAPSAELRTRLEADTHLAFEIYLPEIFRSKPLPARGVIKWSEPEGRDHYIGVEFTQISQAAQDQLKKVTATLRRVTDRILGAAAAGGASEADVEADGDPGWSTS